MLVSGETIHVSGVKDTVDDLIGPMVNRPVLVTVVKRGHALEFLDIEVDE